MYIKQFRATQHTKNTTFDKKVDNSLKALFSNKKKFESSPSEIDKGKSINQESHLPMPKALKYNYLLLI